MHLLLIEPVIPTMLLLAADAGLHFLHSISFEATLPLSSPWIHSEMHMEYIIRIIFETLALIQYIFSVQCKNNTVGINV